MNTYRDEIRLRVALLLLEGGKSSAETSEQVGETLTLSLVGWELEVEIAVNVS
jgi:hypothetical protein